MSTTPPPEILDPESATGGGSARTGYGGGRERPPWAQVGGEWRREWSTGGRGREIPWLGVLLIVLGAAFLLQQVFPGLTLTTLLITAFAVALVGAVVYGAHWLTVPALLVVAFALARLGRELGLLPGDGWTAPGLLPGDGWTALFIGVALLLAWLLARSQGKRRGWALWVGGLLAIYGLIQISGRIRGIPDLGALLPLLLIAAGLLVLAGGRFPGRRSQPTA